MLIRIRSRLGTWRIELNDASCLRDLIDTLESNYGVSKTGMILSFTPNLKSPFQDRPGSDSLKSIGINHGDMVYLEFSSSKQVDTNNSKVVIPQRVEASFAKVKTVDASGNVVASGKLPSQNSSFRPGLSSLRARKLHWTLTDMAELDDNYTFVIKGTKRVYAQSVTLDASACESFQNYCREFGFLKPICGIMYGKYINVEEEKKAIEVAAATTSGKKPFQETKKKMELKDLNIHEDESPKYRVFVDAIYEPSQAITIRSGGSFELLEDAREERADLLANALGLRRVGFIFSHPPRTGSEFTGHEIVQCGLQALTAADGARDSPFVVVKVSTDEQGLASFHGFQLTPQCLDMVAEDALIPMPSNPGVSAVHETFTAVVEAKKAEVVDNDMFIVRVPILSGSSPLSKPFPRFNRDGIPPTIQALKSSLGTNFSSLKPNQVIAKLTDFHLLLFLGEMLDSTTMTEIAEVVRLHLDSLSPSSSSSSSNSNKKHGENTTSTEVGDGYVMMISSLIEG